MLLSLKIRVKYISSLGLESRPLNPGFCAWTKLDAFSTIIFLSKGITLFWLMISYGLQNTSQHFILLEYRGEGQHNYVYLINDIERTRSLSNNAVLFLDKLSIYQDWTLQILLTNNYIVSINRFSQSRKTGLLPLSRCLPCNLCSVIEIS